MLKSETYAGSMQPTDGPTQRARLGANLLQQLLFGLYEEKQGGGEVEREPERQIIFSRKERSKNRFFFY